MGMNINPREILATGGTVLYLLIGLSVYSLALMWERRSFYRRSARHLRPFLQKLRQSLSRGDLAEVMTQSKQYKGFGADVVMSALVGPSQKEDRKNSAVRTLEREATKLQRGLSALGTIGSVAPFIGLLGTVLGVMRAFHDLAGAAGAGPGVVAIGISEALVTTAAGLFVAIPATIAFNYFSTRALQFQDELRWVSEEIIDQLTQKAHT